MFCNSCEELKDLQCENEKCNNLVCGYCDRDNFEHCIIHYHCNNHLLDYQAFEEEQQVQEENSRNNSDYESYDKNYDESYDESKE